MPSRDGDESDSLGVVSNLLDEVGCLLDDFLVPRFGPFGGVHLVDSDDELFDTQGVGQKGVFTGLTILGDTSFELTDTSGDDDYGSDIYITEVVRTAQSACEVPVIMFLMKSR